MRSLAPFSRRGLALGGGFLALMLALAAVHISTRRADPMSQLVAAANTLLDRLGDGDTETRDMVRASVGDRGLRLPRGMVGFLQSVEMSETGDAAIVEFLISAGAGAPSRGQEGTELSLRLPWARVGGQWALAP